MPVMVGYTQDLVRACGKNLGCIKGAAAYVVRRNNNDFQCTVAPYGHISAIRGMCGIVAAEAPKGGFLCNGNRTRTADFLSFLSFLSFFLSFFLIETQKASRCCVFRKTFNSFACSVPICLSAWLRSSF